MDVAYLLLVVISAFGITALVRGINLQPGLVIVLLAGAVSFVPGLPRLSLPPEIMLSIVVPPLLYAATLETSFFGFLRHLRSILGLGVLLVILSMAILAPVAAWLVPGLGLASALVLAAVLAPPDTVTTVSHGHALGLPRRVITVLTGESLINDATALTLFSLAVTRVTGGHALFENPFLLFGYGAVVGIIVGLGICFVAMLIRRRLREPALEAAVGVLVPFAAFLVAEELHASGILAVVMAGFIMSVNASFDPKFSGAFQTRLREGELWPVINALLEGFVFAYIGLQFRFVLDDLTRAGIAFGPMLLVSLVIILLLTAVRLGWVLIFFAGGPLNRWLWRKRLERFQAVPPERRHPGRRGRPWPTLEEIQGQIAALSLTWRERVLVGWTGMRGIVTLAAAASIPLVTSTGAAFPGRTTIQFIAVVVTIGTLLLQGTTLPLLVGWLGLDRRAEATASAADHARADEIAAIPPPLPLPAASYDAGRERLASAVVARDIEDESARAVIRRLDHQQAASTPPAE